MDVALFQRLLNIVVDLEINHVAKKSEARRIYRMETIEIRAVMLDDIIQEISAFRTYVKPEYCHRCLSL